MVCPSDCPPSCGRDGLLSSHSPFSLSPVVWKSRKLESSDPAKDHISQLPLQQCVAMRPDRHQREVSQSHDLKGSGTHPPVTLSYPSRCLEHRCGTKSRGSPPGHRKKLREGNAEQPWKELGPLQVEGLLYTSLVVSSPAPYPATARPSSSAGGNPSL